MKKPELKDGFLLIFLGLILLSLIGNQILLREQFFESSITQKLLYSISQTSLIQFEGSQSNLSLSLGHLIFSLVITQLSGLFFLSFLLWFYWKLFRDKANRYNLKSALILTGKFAFAVEISLFLFFFYAIPTELVNNNMSHKSMAALMFTINSFNNVGFAQIDRLMYPNLLGDQFILQIGIIVGSSLGSLGIFVIDELFSPLNLRKRLADPDIDWSLITKISIYGATGVMVVFSSIFLLIEHNGILAGKNLTESIISSIFEVTGARGFGYSESDLTNSISKLALHFSSLFGSGPFSTSGGFTLLVFGWVYSSNVKKRHLQMDDLLVIQKLMKNLAFYTLLTFGLFLFIRLIADNSFSITELIFDQWQLFSCSQITYSPAMTSSVSIIKALTILSGRLGFVIACYLTLRQNL